MNELAQIFVENFASRLLIPPFSSVLLEAKYYFGQIVAQDLCVAFAGIICAFFANYYFGRIFGLLKKYFDDKTKNLFAKGKSILSGRGRVLLLFSFLPFGSILLLVAGVLQVPFKKIFLFLAIAAGLALMKFIAL
jgi:membrane protein YqaA with SNARE-associated domain